MRKVESELSLEIILSIVTEDELKDSEFCIKIAERALREGKVEALHSLFEKQSGFFVFVDEGLRGELLRGIYSVLNKLTLQKVIEIGKNTLVGNVVAIYYFLKKHKVIKPDKLEQISQLSSLRFFKNPFVIELIPSTEDMQLLIDLDERVVEKTPDEIEKSIKFLEWLFVYDLVAKTKDTVEGLQILYSCSKSPEYQFKKDVVGSLLKEKIDVLIHSLKTLGRRINNKDDLVLAYTEIYDSLVKISVPLFFSLENLRFNNVLYNGNFYLLRYLNDSGNEDLLFPFKQTELSSVQKIFDLSSGIYITPKGRMGKLALQDIFSFKKVTTVDDIAKDKIESVKNLSELSIEQKVREILEDQNITPHGPGEKADIFTTKLFVNNENDIRNSAFILKGRGYPTVNLNSVASNILKAVDLPVDIVFLVFTGNMLDEAQEKFINQCNLNRKMYCILGPLELARLLIAYGKMN